TTQCPAHCLVLRRRKQLRSLLRSKLRATCSAATGQFPICHSVIVLPPRRIHRHRFHLLATGDEYRGQRHPPHRHLQRLGSSRRSRWVTRSSPQLHRYRVLLLGPPHRPARHQRKIPKPEPLPSPVPRPQEGIKITAPHTIWCWERRLNIVQPLNTA